MLSGIDLLGIIGSIETLESAIRELTSNVKNRRDNILTDQKLDYGTKILSREIGQLGSQISKLSEESCAPINNGAMKSGKNLMEKIEAVLAFIRMKTGYDFRTEVKILDNYLTYSGLDDFRRLFGQNTCFLIRINL